MPRRFGQEILRGELGFEGVVVEGTMKRDGHFESQRLMVSHGNEYRAPASGEKPDMKKLIESTTGLGEPERAKTP